jgi:hypothetical protein
MKELKKMFTAESTENAEKKQGTFFSVPSVPSVVNRLFSFQVLTCR